MTKVRIDPGICGLMTSVEATSEDEMEVKINVASGCQSINKMFEILGNTFESYELCLKKPGDGVFYEYARENLPGHCACPVIAGIIKAVEVECKLALPKNATIEFGK
ncbi:MAG: hypothetical protein RR177_04875 [Oscillospiraceae bacterium]